MLVAFRSLGRLSPSRRLWRCASPRAAPVCRRVPTRLPTSPRIPAVAAVSRSVAGAASTRKPTTRIAARAACRVARAHTRRTRVLRAAAHLRVRRDLPIVTGTRRTGAKPTRRRAGAPAAVAGARAWDPAPSAAPACAQRECAPRAWPTAMQCPRTAAKSTRPGTRATAARAVAPVARPILLPRVDRESASLAPATPVSAIAMA